MNYCELIRNEYKHEREFCLYPLRVHDGLVQACTVAYNRATTINLRFFDEKYEFQVWTDVETRDILYQPSNRRYDCFIIREFMKELLRHNTEAALIMLYSLFFAAKRAIKTADAYDAYAAYAAYAAYDAYTTDAYATAYAAYDAYATAYAAYDAYADAKHLRAALRHLFKYRKAWRNEL